MTQGTKNCENTTNKWIGILINVLLVICSCLNATERMKAGDRFRPLNMITLFYINSPLYCAFKFSTHINILTLTISNLRLLIFPIVLYTADSLELELSLYPMTSIRLSSNRTNGWQMFHRNLNWSCDRCCYGCWCYYPYRICLTCRDEGRSRPWTWQWMPLGRCRPPSNSCRCFSRF